MSITFFFGGVASGRCLARRALLRTATLAALFLLRRCAVALSQVQHRPIKQSIQLEALAEEELFEQSFQVGVVGLVVEAERAGVLHVRAELGREVFAEGVDGSVHFFSP